MNNNYNNKSEYDIFLAKSSLEIKNIFYDIKEMIHGFDGSIHEQINKTMLSLKKTNRGKTRGVVWLQPGANYLKVYLAKNNYSNLIYEIFPDGFGGYPYFKVTKENFNIENIKQLTEKAIKKIEDQI